jgi:hypothetical protein
MSRFKKGILSVLAVTIMTACGSSGSGDETTRSASKALSLQANATPSPPPSGKSPPPNAKIGQLGVLDTATIGADAANAALADRKLQSTLRDLALRVSSSAGVEKPTQVLVVAAADHQVAESLVSGAIINDHSPVYVIKVAGGRFTAQHHPAEVAAPQGDILTLTVDAASLRVTDIGIDDVAADLSVLGRVVDLSSP